MENRRRETTAPHIFSMISRDQLGCPRVVPEHLPRPFPWPKGEIRRRQGNLPIPAVTTSVTTVGYEFPIKIPTANTIVPPTTTSKTARRKGVSMYFARIQAMIHSSTNTTANAMPVATLKFGMR